ncbi:MAG: peptidylprolyl isomerase [Actinobacteria bacterium]|nr:peptidylprolyl isomerase [Actinomycetota bacterium]
MTIRAIRGPGQLLPARRGPLQRDVALALRIHTGSPERVSFHTVPSEKRARQRAAREAKLAAQAKTAKKKKLIKNSIVALVVAAVVIGTGYLIFHKSSKSKSATTTTSTTIPSTSTTTPVSPANAKAQALANKIAVSSGCPKNPMTRVNTLTWTAPPPMTINPANTYKATVKTTVGTFVITLDPKAAPIAVNNFIFLAKHNFYRCVIFHRVIPGFMDQTGDPTGTGTGGPGYSFSEPGPPASKNPNTQYPIGAVAMANSNSPATTDPTTNGSQFFIVTGPQGESLPPDYTLFGQVTSGMSVVQKINAEGSPNGVPPNVIQRMLSVTIT